MERLAVTIACELYTRCVRRRYHYTILKYMPVLGTTNYGAFMES